MRSLIHFQRQVLLHFTNINAPVDKIELKIGKANVAGAQWLVNLSTY